MSTDKKPWPKRPEPTDAEEAAKALQEKAAWEAYRRKKAPPRTADSFPPEYRKIMELVLHTEEAFLVDNLGNAKSGNPLGRYVHMRQQMNMWRQALKREYATKGGTPKLGEFIRSLDRVVVSVSEDPDNPWLVVRLRDSRYSNALKDKLADKLKELDIPDVPAPRAEPTLGESDEPEPSEPGSEMADVIKEFYSEKGE